MSREFKFKCWDKELKYWLKPDDMPTLMSGEIGAVWEFGGEEDYIFCQYTGLKDKNGKEIYEGDILLHYDFIGMPETISFNDKRPMTFVVEWDSKKARWAERHVHQYNNYTLTDGSFLYAEYKVNNANEIIGNIHENPELLTHPAEGRN